MLELVKTPFKRCLGHGNTPIDAWRCLCFDKENKPCKRVELSYAKILIHIAVEHGIRRFKLESK